MSSLTGKKLEGASYMFGYSEVKTIDISGLNTSLPSLQPDPYSVLVGIFCDTKAEIVYVKSQGDINRLKSEEFDTEFPSSMKFEVK